MTILLDQCAPQHLAQLLREWGYPVALLREHLDVGSPDADVIQTAQRLDAVLLTTDTDFQKSTVYPPQNYAGIIVLEEEPRARKAIAQQLKIVLQTCYRDKLRGTLFVIDANGYRIYPKPQAQ